MNAGGARYKRFPLALPRLVFPSDTANCNKSPYPVRVWTISSIRSRTDSIFVSRSGEMASSTEEMSLRLVHGQSLLAVCRMIDARKADDGSIKAASSSPKRFDI